MRETVTFSTYVVLIKWASNFVNWSLPTAPSTSKKYSLYQSGWVWYQFSGLSTRKSPALYGFRYQRVYFSSLSCELPQTGATIRGLCAWQPMGTTLTVCRVPVPYSRGTVMRSLSSYFIGQRVSHGTIQTCLDQSVWSHHMLGQLRGKKCWWAELMIHPILVPPLCSQYYELLHAT